MCFVVVITSFRKANYDLNAQTQLSRQIHHKKSAVIFSAYMLYNDRRISGYAVVLNFIIRYSFTNQGLTKEIKEADMLF